MSRKRKILYSLFAVLSLGWLMGDDCEIDIDGFGGYFRPYDSVVVYDPGPYFYDPYWYY